MLEKLKKLNKIDIYTTDDELFSLYGRKLNFDVSEVINHLEKEVPSLKDLTKANYVTHRQDLENYPCFKAIQKEIFGYLPIQIGVVKGKNQCATGTEFHQGSEVNIAITDCILILGSKNDFINEQIHIDQMKAFYIKKGEVIEIYSNTLHYTPIEVSSDGFSLVVVLLKGTNTEIEFEKNSVLCKKNKWYVCHKSQTNKIEQGFKVGLLGELLKIEHF